MDQELLNTLAVPAGVIAAAIVYVGAKLAHAVKLLRYEHSRVSEALFNINRELSDIRQDVSLVADAYAELPPDLQSHD